MMIAYRSSQISAPNHRRDPSHLRGSSHVQALPPHGIDYSSYKSLEGVHVLITGSARGIGLATARQLAALRATIILADISDTRDAELAIIKHVPGAAVIRAPNLDLGRLESIYSFADWMAARPLNILINNAGANFMGCDPWFEKDHGFAGLPMVNFVGPMTLTRRLLQQLAASSISSKRRSRIINVCSIMHRYARLPEDPEIFLKDWGIGGSYRNAKLALTQATTILQAKHGMEGVDTVSVDPGAVYSNLWSTSKVFGPGTPMSLVISSLFSTPDDACASCVHAAALSSPSQRTSQGSLGDPGREVLTPGGYYARGMFANELLCKGVVPEPLAGLLSVTDWPLRSISKGLLASKIKQVPVAPNALDLQGTESIFRYLEQHVWKSE